MLRTAQLLRNRKGQAAIEAALALPFLIWLIYYMINAFHAIHTAHVGQKAAAASLYQRLNNRSKFVVDDVESRLHGRQFMAVQYTDEDGKTPKRRVVLDTENRANIFSAIGICKEPGCR